VKNAPYKAVLFDFDGTLIDSISVLFDVYNKFLFKYGFNGTFEEFNEFNGPSLKEIIAILKVKYNIELPENDLLNTYIELLNDSYSKNLRYREGALDILNYLKVDRKLQLYLITSSSREIVQNFISINNLKEYFYGYTYGDEVQKSKPSPEIYTLSLRKFNLQRNDVFIVEDSLNGIKSGKAAGIKVCAISGTHSVSVLANSGADYIINSLSEIRDILQ